MQSKAASILSYLFHPLFLVTYMLFVLMVVNPYLFSSSDEKASGLIVISVVIISVFFPLLSIALMRMLGLIDGFEMEDSKERVGPLVATIMFYLWLYLNIKTNSLIPTALSFFVLGTIISLFIGFFINNFTKVSLHTIGLGGFLTALIIDRFNYFYDNFILSTPFGKIIVGSDLLIIFAILIAGLVGTARMSKAAHTPKQLYGGYAVGILSQIIAFLAY